ncbi:MAG: aminotransferase class V-fold PLP-dependent enzyme [Steroidobacteraceae bacterium]
MTALPDQLPLGRGARPLWTLRDDASFLNHGSYGAVPRVVQQAQQLLRDEMESHPDAFMHRVEPLAGGAVREVAAALAAMTGTSAERVALVENATSGVQAVLNSLPFQHGDQILLTDHQYNAVRLAVDARCRQTGAEAVVVRIPLPTDADQIVERVLAAAGPRVRFALLDHITSPTALVFPVQRLATELRRRGIPLFVDGAHAIGQVPLDLPSIGADWYVTNLHKWLYAPKGTAMLYASGGAAPLTWPLVTSHYLELGFPRSFDYIGTRDYTAWLTAPRALAFYQALGPARLMEHETALVRAGSEALQAIGAVAVAPPDLAAAMRAFILPQSRPALERDAAQVMQRLWDEARIQIRCTTLGGALLLRISAQAYVEAEELTRLAQVLHQQGWPARQ